MIKDMLEEVLRSLSPRERIIIKLSYLYDKTHQEIGEMLRMPAGSVSSIIKRAKEKLKRKLEGKTEF
jgi:RNA polymerase sigma factor (sigma-70 family)